MNNFAAEVAKLIVPPQSKPKTVRRNTGEVALYKCTIAFLAPRNESKVRCSSNINEWICQALF
ncbi:MAG: hypothetical protein IGS39_18275 [Calothrix sp. C42_A2020_038]|nr:hypothetical protein [Calothrix sp. C42_A2020_038]